ncbi:secretin N-terminal domain-containing protein, partial [Xenorhabdus bovienii]
DFLHSDTLLAAPDSASLQSVKLITQTYKVNHVRAKDLAPVMEIYLKAGREAGAKVFPFDGANILVVTASAPQHEELKTVLPEIDVPRDQVLIEALMFETTEGKAFDFSFSAGSQTGSVAGGVNTDRLASVLSAAGGSFGIFNGNVLGLSLKAVQKDSASSVLSVPRILTMSGQRGYISVGQNVPFVTGKVTGEAASVNNPFQTIERHDVGVSLSVTPIVTPSDVVIMNIHVRADSISSLTAASDIITNQRQIETTVHLNSGQTLLLGGLIDDRSSNEDSSVPFISRIPLIGWLFSSESDDAQKRALYVMIHARVLRAI